ncbi:MAG: response regulator transcription factor [Cytophagales bacterium]|nr:response regulator transcription factor [Cytophagales bacterium]
MINVALADDHEIVRSGIKTVIEDDPDIAVIWEAENGKETLEKLENTTPDVLVLDIRMPIMSGLDVAQHLMGQQKDFRILMLTMHNDSEYILKSLQYQADGYLLKDTSKTELNKAIKVVHGGHKYFSGDISDTIINSFVANPSEPVTVPTKSEPSRTSIEDFNLTKREKQILDLITKGFHNKDIAENLGKSIRTVETHRFNIMKKMNVNNVTDLLNKVK